MPESPPPELVALLERLGLATAGQISAMSGRVRRLAKELPRFESVWVDALAQARLLTPFQAAEINEGRGDRLCVGPFAIRRRLPSPGYVDYFEAQEISSRHLVRLAVATSYQGEADRLTERLEELVAKSVPLRRDHHAPAVQSGVDEGRAWVSGRLVTGQTASEWMIHHGRLPPEAVLEIARQMTADLVVVEEAQICHADIGPVGLILSDGGDALLPLPGVRAVLRPEEGFGHAELAPEDYDGLAPQRITDGTSPTTADDLYACGVLWWHLLAGRPPLPGGSTLAKLKAITGGQVPDVRPMAPDVPASLATAIAACVGRDANRRPESASRLAAMLGPPTQNGRVALARCVKRSGLRPARWTASLRAIQRSKQLPAWIAAAAACLVAVLAVGWSIWNAGLPGFGVKSSDGPAVVAEGSADVLEDLPQAFPLTVEPADEPGEPSSDPLPSGQSTGDLVLPSDHPLAVESLDLMDDQRVRGEPGKRPLVVVSPAGLVVRAENVRFENIDFVWQPAHDADTTLPDIPAIVQLQASTVAFHGCSFQAAKTTNVAPAAILWTYPVDRAESEMLLPSGRVRLSDCVLRRVSVGVACRTLGAPAVELANVLSFGPGPLIELDHCPGRDEPVAISLSDVTLRDAGALLVCRYQRMDDRPGGISIRADGSAFVTRRQVPLLSFHGPTSPEPLLRAIDWSGQGSVVSPETTIAGWQPADGPPQSLDDGLITIAGLVRGQVEFAGPSTSGPSASQIVDWQVPLRSPNPPGIDPRLLVWPDW